MSEDPTPSSQEDSLDDYNYPEPDIKSFPKGFVAFIATALVVQMSVGLVCNLTVLIVYHMSRKNKTSAGVGVGGGGGAGGQGGGPVTNTISAALITNLNIVDVLISLSAVPLTLTYILTDRFHHPLFCMCQEGLISFAASASALNLLVISIDRYQTIVSPFQRWLRPANLPWVLLVLWGLSLFGLCVPFLALTTSKWQTIGNRTEFPCFALADSFSSGHRYYFEIYYVLLYLITNVAMVVCYLQIFRAAKNRINTRIALIKAASVHLPTGANKSLESSSASQKTNERTMTKMTMMIVLTFMICWAPHSVTSIAIIIVRTTYHLEMTQITCVTLAYSATLLHPLLYAFMRRNFREAFRDSLYKRGAATGQQRTPTVITSPQAPATRRGTLVVSAVTCAESHRKTTANSTRKDSKGHAVSSKEGRHTQQACAQILQTFVVTNREVKVKQGQEEGLILANDRNSVTANSSTRETHTFSST